jgi:hypothetical protein
MLRGTENRCILKKCFDSDEERSIFRRKISGSKYLEITKNLHKLMQVSNKDKGNRRF